jgi:hypothetical protein
MKITLLLPAFVALTTANINFIKSLNPKSSTVGTVSSGKLHPRDIAKRAIPFESTPGSQCYTVIPLELPKGPLGWTTICWQDYGNGQIFCTHCYFLPHDGNHNFTIPYEYNGVS